MLDIGSLTMAFELLWPTNVILLVHGNCIYAKNTVTHVLNYLFRISFLSYVYFLCFHRLRNAYKRPTLYEFGDLAYALFCIAQHHVLWLQRDKILLIAEYCLKAVNPKQSKDIKRVSLMLFGAFWLAYVAVAATHLYKGVSQIDASLNAVVNIVHPLYVGNWQTSSSAVYLSVLHCVHVYCAILYDEMEHKLSNSKIEFSCERALIELKRLANFKGMFDKAFNVFPALWLLNMLLFTSAYLFIFQQPSINNQLRVVETLYYLKWLSTAFVTFYFITKHQKLCADRRQGISMMLLNRNDLPMSEKTLLLLELEKQTALTGLNQFQIVPSLLLSFIASVISFSVLFLQVFHP